MTVRQRNGLTVVEGGDVYYRKSGRGYSYIRHLDRACPRLRRSEVREVREVDLWPGFICETCRVREGTRAA